MSSLSEYHLRSVICVLLSISDVNVRYRKLLKFQTKCEHEKKPGVCHMHVNATIFSLKIVLHYSVYARDVVYCEQLLSLPHFVLIFLTPTTLPFSNSNGQSIPWWIKIMDRLLITKRYKPIDRRNIDRWIK